MIRKEVYCEEIARSNFGGKKTNSKYKKGKILKDTILMVEDDKDIQLLLSCVLKVCRYESVTASNGKEALKKLRKMKKLPCPILTDNGMPE